MQLYMSDVISLYVKSLNPLWFVTYPNTSVWSPSITYSNKLQLIVAHDVSSSNIELVITKKEFLAKVVHV